MVIENQFRVGVARRDPSGSQDSYPYVDILTDNGDAAFVVLVEGMSDDADAGTEMRDRLSVVLL
jgi:hypothetical protein